MLRIPVAPIGNGENIPTMDHFVEREVFVKNPGRGFLQPRVPYRIAGHPTRPFTPAPTLGQHEREIRNELARGRPAEEGNPTTQGPDDAWPLAGVRVVDMTAFWAGPYATYTLACLGADVIHVESVQRPDGMRFGAVRPPSEPEWWEWGPTFHSANAGKRSITLDLTRDDGRALLRRLIEQSDVLVENYSPRVMEQFGLTWDVVHAWNPRLVMVRMPAFGLDGPWRDRVGFAQTMEQASGMAWLTGYADTAPMNARGPCDPLAGLHSAFSALVGLQLRERTGSGSHIEATMVETALNAAAEQVIEWSAHAQLLSRDGNHHYGAGPQGVYAVADKPEGTMGAVAVCVETDAQWRALVELVDDARLSDPRFADRAQRLAARDLFDEVLTEWCAPRTTDEAVLALLGAGVPAAPVVGARYGDRNPQHDARGFFEAVEHAVIGTHRIAAFPVVFGRQPPRRFARPAPRLGEHNREVLSGLLGVDDAEIARLAADKIIGTRPGGDKVTQRSVGVHRECWSPIVACCLMSFRVALIGVRPLCLLPFRGCKLYAEVWPFLPWSQVQVRAGLDLSWRGCVVGRCSNIRTGLALHRVHGDAASVMIAFPGRHAGDLGVEIIFAAVRLRRAVRRQRILRTACTN